MRPVTVTVREGEPLCFFDKKQKVAIDEIADHWRETGRWWTEEVPQDFYLANTAGGAFLLSHEVNKDVWYAKPVQ